MMASYSRGTIGTFHERNTTLQKTLEVNGNHPRKRAFGRFGGLLLVRLPRSSLIHLCCGCRSWFLRLGIWGRDLFCFRSARLFLPCGLRWRGVQAWSCSINNPKRVSAEHEE